MLEQRVVLEHEPNTTVLDAAVGQIAIVEIDGTRIRRLQPCDGAQQRRLARAGRTQQRNQLTRLNGQRHVIERGDADILLPEIFRTNLHKDVCAPISGAAVLRSRRRTGLQAAS